MPITRRDVPGPGRGGPVGRVAGRPDARPASPGRPRRPESPTPNDHVLVVVELAGGNDGLNTVVPFEDALYYKNRRRLGWPKAEVHKLDDRVGLHPKMGAMAGLFKAGELAVVQGVGYPKPDRSHFRSMEIWHTASVDPTPPTSGWLGRCLDATGPAGDEAPPGGMSLGGSLPQAFQADRAVVPVVAQLDAFNEEAEADLAGAKRSADD